MACNSNTCRCFGRLVCWFENSEIAYAEKALKVAGRKGRARDYVSYQAKADAFKEALAQLKNMKCDAPDPPPPPEPILVPAPWWKSLSFQLLNVTKQGG